jgi:hypothetical protein
MPISRLVKWFAITALMLYGAYFAVRYLVLRDLAGGWIAGPAAAIAAVAGALPLLAYARRTASRPAVLALAMLMALGAIPIGFRVAFALGISPFSLWMYAVSAAMLFATSFLAQAALLEPRAWTIAAATPLLSVLVYAWNETDPSAGDAIAMAVAFGIAYGGARARLACHR